MRKAALLLLLAWFLSSGALPPDVGTASREGLLHLTRVRSGWDSPSRATIPTVAWVVKKTYGREALSVWPVVGAGGRLTAYAITLQAPPPQENTAHGLLPVRGVLLSASMEEPPFLAEFSVPVEALFSCGSPSEIVLVRRFALVSRCRGEYYVGKKKLSPQWVERFALRSGLKDKGNFKVSRGWVSALAGSLSNGKVLAIAEFDSIWPIDHNRTWKVPAMVEGKTPQKIIHDHSDYCYYGYYGAFLAIVGTLSSAAWLRWGGKPYGFRGPVYLQWYDWKNGEDNTDINAPFLTRTFYCTWWVPMGVYTDELDFWSSCELALKNDPLWYGSRLLPAFKTTVVSDLYWRFAERNRSFYYSDHRWYRTYEEVVIPFVTSFGGRFVYETYSRPPFVIEVGREAARRAWFRYFKERITRQGFYFDSSWPDKSPLGYPGVVEPIVQVVGWDEGKGLVGTFMPEGWVRYAGPNGGFVLPPGISWIGAEFVGGYPGWLFPPREFSDTPPSVYFPTRALVYEGERLRIVADGHWDREGEEVSWEIESCQLPVVERGSWSFTVEADAREGDYICWVRYSDGHNTVHHPIVIHLLPTYRFSEE